MPTVRVVVRPLRALSAPHASRLLALLAAAVAVTAGAGCAREADTSLGGNAGAPYPSSFSASSHDAGADPQEAATSVQPPGGSPGGGPATCPESAPFHAFEYAHVAVQPGACEADEVEAFLAACGDRGSAHACDTWMAANTRGGGAGTTCGNC
ncbi:MAG TPA: hypothetical protein VIY73_04525, partial [Polyangiaceae bacterium]